MIAKLLLALAIVGTVQGDLLKGCGEMCSHRLGCFTNCPPFGHTKERPFSPLPWGSEVINTKFLLFTRENQNEYKEVSALDPAKVHESKFKSNRKTIFIIHGFLETGKNQWLVDMCKALLQVSEVNCFCVDWKGGSFAPYSQVANNARVVGAEIAHFLTYLLDNYNFSLLDVHLIGHSMGAHVAAEAGGRQRGIERITGLDPAGPYFSRTPPEVCLDKTDALFVDVIHTNAISIGPLGFGGFGVDHPVGNADFFPNGGKLQPGCDEISVRPGKLDDIMDDLMADVFCSHRRSCALFTASIGHPDGFYSYSAPTYNDFQKGAGFPCIDGDCNIMGYHVKYTHDEDIETNQTYYMNTGKPENLKSWRYHVKVHVKGSLFLAGSILMSFCTSNKCTDYYNIHSGVIWTGALYTEYVDVKVDIEPIHEVVFFWRKKRFNALFPKLGASNVTVQSGPTGRKYYFCGSEMIEDGASQTLEAC